MQQADFDSVCLNKECEKKCFLTRDQLQQHNGHKLMTAIQLKEKVTKDQGPIQEAFLAFEKAINLDELLANLTEVVTKFTQKLRIFVEQNQACKDIRMMNEITKETLTVDRLKPFSRDLINLKKPSQVQKTLKAVGLLKEYTMNQTQSIKELITQKFGQMEADFKTKYENARPKIVITQASAISQYNLLPQQNQQINAQDAVCYSIDAFAQNYYSLPFESQTTLHALEVQIVEAKDYLSKLPELQDYSESNLQMALLKIMWYERFHSKITMIPQNQFIYKHLQKMVPNREPYNHFQDWDHKFLALTIELGRLIYAQDQYSQGIFMAYLGILCCHRYNVNMILFERSIFQEAYNILIEYDDIEIILKTRTYLSKTYSKQENEAKACQGYDSALDSDTWEVPVAENRIITLKIMILKIILDVYPPIVEAPRYYDQLQQLQELAAVI